MVENKRHFPMLTDRCVPHRHISDPLIRWAEGISIYAHVVHTGYRVTSALRVVIYIHEEKKNATNGVNCFVD